MTPGLQRDYGDKERISGKKEGRCCCAGWGTGAGGLLVTKPENTWLIMAPTTIIETILDMLPIIMLFI